MTDQSTSCAYLFPDLDLVVYMETQFLGHEPIEIEHLISNLAHRRMPT
jgi:hypothetical protein